MMMTTFSVFDYKYHFWVNLVQKSKYSVKAEILTFSLFRIQW